MTFTQVTKKNAKEFFNASLWQKCEEVMTAA